MKSRILNIAAFLLFVGAVAMSSKSTTDNTDKTCCIKKMSCCYKGSACCAK